MADWLKNAVIYQVFIDRFFGYSENVDAMQPQFVGGNIGGITAKLPYLIDLGVDAIWLTPFFATTDYHGYSTTDFYKVDEHFGTLSDIKALATACHKAGIKIIVDFTANHTSDQHPFFLEAHNDPNSLYRHWYYFKSNNEYLRFLHFNTLPKLNLDYEPAREHVIGAAEYWIGELDADALRLDHPIGPSDDFWREFARRVRLANPRIKLIGEAVLKEFKKGDFATYKLPHPARFVIAANLSRYPFDPVMKHYVGLFDGCLDYTYFHLLKRVAAGELSEQTFRRMLTKHYAKFPADYALPAFIDNHDTNRYLYLVNQDYDRLKQALELEFSLPQPKIIYYGDEVGMTQAEAMYINTGWAGDLPARAKMNWQPDAKQQELLALYKDLIARSKPKQ